MNVHAYLLKIFPLTGFVCVFYINTYVYIHTHKYTHIYMYIYTGDPKHHLRRADMIARVREDMASVVPVTHADLQTLHGRTGMGSG